jgi:hypothetical protein
VAAAALGSVVAGRRVWGERTGVEDGMIEGARRGEEREGIVIGISIMWVCV